MIHIVCSSHLELMSFWYDFPMLHWYKHRPPHDMSSTCIYYFRHFCVLSLIQFSSRKQLQSCQWKPLNFLCNKLLFAFHFFPKFKYVVEPSFCAYASIASLNSNIIVFLSQIIAPLSASGVVLDDPESTKLLSSVAIALSNCGRWVFF